MSEHRVGKDVACVLCGQAHKLQRCPPNEDYCYWCPEGKRFFSEHTTFESEIVCSEGVPVVVRNPN